MLTGRVPRMSARSASQRKLETLFLGLVAVVLTGSALMFMKQEIVPLLVAIMICVFVKFIWDLVDDNLGRVVVFTLTGLISVWLFNFVIDNISAEYGQIKDLIPEYEESLLTKIEEGYAWLEDIREAEEQPPSDTTVIESEAPVEPEEDVMAQQAIATLLETSFALAGLPSQVPPRVKPVPAADTLALAEPTEAPPDSVANPLKFMLRDSLKGMASHLPGVLGGLLGILTDLLASLMTSLIYAGFILGEMRLLSWKVRRAFPGQGTMLYTSLRNVAQGIADYFGIKTVMSLATAICTYLVLVIADVRLAFFWSVVTFFLNYIPNVGSLFALGIVGLAVGLEPIESKFLVIFALCVIQFAFGNIVEPLIAGDTLDMSALAMLLSLAIWYRLWGVAGALLSVPITFAVKELCKLHPSLRFVTVFVEGQRNDDKLLRIKRKFWRLTQYLRPLWMAGVALLTRPIRGEHDVKYSERERFPAPVLPNIGDCIELSDGSMRILVGRRLDGGELCYDYLVCKDKQSRVETYVYRSRQRLLLRRTHWDHTIACGFPLFAKGEQLRYEGKDGHLETFEVESRPGYAQFGDRDLPEAWHCSHYVFEGDTTTRVDMTIHETVPWPLRVVENGIETYLVDGIVGGSRLFERRRRMNDWWNWVKQRFAAMFGLISDRPALSFPDVRIARPLIISGQWTVALANVPREFRWIKPGFVYPVAGSEPETLWVQVVKVEELRLREATRGTLQGSAYQSVEELAKIASGRILRIEFRYLGEVILDDQKLSPA